MDAPHSDLERRIQGQRVPEPLLQELHDARLFLHKARIDLEKAVDDDQYGHQERVNEQEKIFREAETELEKVSAKIQEILDRPL